MRSASLSAMVLLPEPDTPISTSAQSTLALSGTKVLRKGGLIDQPDGFALGARAARGQVFAVKYAGQDRALAGSARFEQHLAAGAERRQSQCDPRYERLDMGLWHVDHPARSLLSGRIARKQRGGVTIGPDAEQHKVEQRPGRIEPV